jgi:diaminohydroxyphosphoribosylaminopyrimidine deaminase/5-amino-6-(5-phosphoribosylamino)uracil reductase
MQAEECVQKCLELAQQSRLLCPPNPAVGCVLTGPDGRLLGLGATQATGGPHAEVMALRDAAAHGLSVAGATAYVSLEPCAHFGRTGPCCDALIQAGIKKVVAAMADPNPLVSGQGFARLRAAGVEVEVGPGAAQAFELNIGFFSRMVRRVPWVRMKMAASLDGKTALTNGVSQWITGAAARADGHAWRARACAILTGVGTVLHDNPRLDVREVPTPRQPTLVVVDSRLQTPPQALLFQARRQVIVYAAVPHEARQRALEASGAAVVYRPEAASAKVDLTALLQDLAQREINELHVEAGHKLNGSLLRAGLVDELLVYLAPKLMGQGCDMAHFGPLTDLAQAIALEFRSTAMLGPDLRILARLPGRDRFWDPV